MNLRSMARTWLPPGVASWLRRAARRVLPARWRLARLLALPWSRLPRGRVRRMALRVVHLAWGNPGYSASVELCAVVDRLAGDARLVVEMGSGLTTLLLRAGAAGTSRRVVTLEHDEEWGAAMSGALPSDERHELRVVGLAPVEPGIEWYDTPVEDLAAADLVLCDGPPAVTPGGRRGILHLLDRRRGSATVVFDDVDRDEEAALLAEISARYGTAAPEIRRSREKAFAVVEVPAPRS